MNTQPQMPGETPVPGPFDRFDKFVDSAFSFRSLRQFIILFAILFVVAFGSRIVMVETGKTMVEAYRLQETHKALNQPTVYMTLSPDEILKMATSQRLGGGYTDYGDYATGAIMPRPPRNVTPPEQLHSSSPSIDSLKDQSPAPATSSELLGQATEQVSGALDKTAEILKEIDKALQEEEPNPAPKVEIDPDSLQKLPLELVPPSSVPAPAPSEAPKLN